MRICGMDTIVNENGLVQRVNINYQNCDLLNEEFVDDTLISRFHVIVFDGEDKYLEVLIDYIQHKIENYMIYYIGNDEKLKNIAGINIINDLEEIEDLLPYKFMKIKSLSINNDVKKQFRNKFEYTSM